MQNYLYRFGEYHAEEITCFIDPSLYDVAQYRGNVDLCRLTEQVDPYMVSKFNHWTSSFLDKDAEAVREDDRLTSWQQATHQRSSPRRAEGAVEVVHLSRGGDGLSSLFGAAEGAVTLPHNNGERRGNSRELAIGRRRRERRAVELDRPPPLPMMTQGDGDRGWMPGIGGGCWRSGADAKDCG